MATRELTTKEKLYQAMRKSALGRAAIGAHREMKASPAKEARVLASGFDFIDRSRGMNKLLIILAGYKQQLWGDVFERIGTYCPDDVDVCIMTSGLVNEELKALAQERGWSYLSTEVNHLSHIQNRAIELHPRAEWIYKIDEDMFITEGFFEKLLDLHIELENNSLYVPAFTAPLINVNCYGHLRLLEQLDLLDDFAALNYTELHYADGLHHNLPALEDPRVARYMWGETQETLADIDALSKYMATLEPHYSICPFRFSIGAFLFRRSTWDEFEHFPITFIGSDYGIGDDEEYFCQWAYLNCRAMAICEDVVVGHLGYGGEQTEAMLEFYESHREQFACKH